MAISRAKEATEEIAVCSFTVDVEAELTQLPTLTTGNEEQGWECCLHGSSALCNGNGKLYTLRGDNTWKQFGKE